MNRNHDPMEPNNESDALNAYLDRLAGVADEPSAPLAPRMQGAVDRLFALAARADGIKASFGTRNKRSTSITRISRPTAKSRRRAHPTAPTQQPRRWSQSIQFVSTAALIMCTVAGVYFAASNGGKHNDEGGTSGPYSVIPIATLPANVITSSIPPPAAVECTAAPRSDADLIQILVLPPHPGAAMADTSQLGEPVDPATAKDVMHTFRQFQACSQKGMVYRESASIMTEEGVRFDWYGEPRSGKTPKPLSVLEITTRLNSLFVPTPSSSPIAGPRGQNVVLTIFPEDVRFRSTPADTISSSATPNPGKDWVIVATAYWVNIDNGQVTFRTPTEVTFVKVKGQWLINHIAENRVGAG